MSFLLITMETLYVPAVFGGIDWKEYKYINKRHFVHKG